MTAASTPEGRVKAAVRRVLDHYKPYVWTYMPVPSGYGTTSLDYLVCAAGTFVAVETKAMGGRPTDRQAIVIDMIRMADGYVLVIDDCTAPALAELDQHLAEQVGKMLQRPFLSYAAASGRAARNLRKDRPTYA